MFRAVIVHGPDDVIEVTAPTMKKAEAKATTVERREHGKEFSLDTYHWKWKSKRTKDSMQYGTDYHYIVIERIIL